MKKIAITLLLFTSLFLIGCQRTTKITITTHSDISETSIIEYEMLSQLLSDEESFILYISSATCSSCQEFEVILSQFIQDNHVLIYQIEAVDQLPLDNELLDYQYTPTIFIIQNGLVLDTSNPIADENVFVSVESFGEYILKWVTIT